MWPFNKVKETNDKLQDEIKNVTAKQQKKFSKYSGFDQRYREALGLVVARLIHECTPNQDSPEFMTKLVTNTVNVMMPDYNGSIKKEGILADMEKDFLPQPAMLSHWAEKHGFKQITPEKISDADKEKMAQEEGLDKKSLEDGMVRLNPNDVAGKYVLTYYTPFANSWAERTSTDITDTTNKHWYSHCKSAIYDENGVSLGASNPELANNDTTHTPTEYVPKDSISYVIDYEKLGFTKEDVKYIEEGFKYQQEGINIMDKKMQDSIFALKDKGLSQEEIINLWNNQINLTDPKNLEAIEQYLNNGGEKEKISTIEGLSKADNKYQYNLQDYSCAIQPTAPLLYATAAKIKEEGLDDKQANKLREQVGLYNIYDKENYGKINDNFYKNYSDTVISEAKNALQEDIKEFLKNPIDKGLKMASHKTFVELWAKTKTMRTFPEMVGVMWDITFRKEKEKENTNNTKTNNTLRETYAVYATQQAQQGSR